MNQDHKDKIKQSLIGKGAKDYLIIPPDGEPFKITNLRQWCLNNEFSYQTMSCVAGGSKPSYKGYKVSRLQD